MRVYTRTGDDGTTGLADGSRTTKAAARVASYGDLDELNSVIGLLLAERLPVELEVPLARVQSCLFDAGAFLAHPGGGYALPAAVTEPAWIERWIDDMQAVLPPLRSFILPGGTRPAAVTHLARTVCRRAERAAVALADGGEPVDAVVPFLNRLSDALFVCARWLNANAGVVDTPWRRQRQDP